MKSAYWGGSQLFPKHPANGIRDPSIRSAPRSVLFGCSIEEITTGPRADPTLLLNLDHFGERRVIVDTGFCANALFSSYAAPSDTTIFLTRHDVEVAPFGRRLTFSEVALPKVLLDRAKERRIDGVLNPQLIDLTAFTIVDFSLGRILGFPSLKLVREYIGIGWRCHRDRDDRNYGVLSTVLTLDEEVTGLVSIDTGSSHTRFFLPRGNGRHDAAAPWLEHIIRIGTSRKIVRTMDLVADGRSAFEAKYIGALGYDLLRNAALVLTPQAEDHWELVLN